MSEVAVLFTGIREFSVAVDKMIAASNMAARKIVTEGGRAIVDATHAHMNGRPGPERRSGDLYRSVKTVVTYEGGSAWRSETAPTGLPYERRVELGFHGTDSIGRRYNQPAYPFLAPGLIEAGPAIDIIATKAWFGATRGEVIG